MNALTMETMMRTLIDILTEDLWQKTNWMTRRVGGVLVSSWLLEKHKQRKDTERCFR
jgi:hypothetical protein